MAGQELWDAFKTAVLKAERVLLYEMGFHFNVRLSSPTCPTACFRQSLECEVTVNLLPFWAWLTSYMYRICPSLHGLVS